MRASVRATVGVPQVGTSCRAVRLRRFGEKRIAQHIAWHAHFALSDHQELENPHWALGTW